MNKKICFILLVIIILSGLFFRIKFLVSFPGYVNADNAVVGLMARHVLKGNYPTFIWEYKYAGAFLSYFIAFLFRIFGISFPVFIASTLFFYVMSIIFTYKFVQLLYDRATALIASLFLAMPPVLVFLFSIDKRGCYSETLFLGPLLFYLTLLIIKKEAVKNRLLFSHGFVIGFFFWISPLSVPYIATSFLMLLFCRNKFTKAQYLGILLFMILGSLPLVIYNIKAPFATALNLLTRPFDASKNQVKTDLINLGITGTFLNHFKFYFSVFFIRVREVITAFFNSAGILNPLLEKNIITSGIHRLFFFIVPFFYAVKILKGKSFPEKILGLHLFTSFLFCVIFFLRNPRFAIPAWTVLPVLLSSFVFYLYRTKNRYLSLGFCSLIVFSDIIGYLYLETKTPPRLYELSEFLKKNNFLYGYASYWVAYPVMLLSEEKVIIAPTLNVHSVHPKSLNSYPYYANTVNKTAEVFYVISSDINSQNKFEEILYKNKIAYKKYVLTDFAVYFSFSKRFYPEDINLSPELYRLKDPFFL